MKSDAPECRRTLCIAWIHMSYYSILFDLDFAVEAMYPRILDRFLGFQPSTLSKLKEATHKLWAMI